MKKETISVSGGGGVGGYITGIYEKLAEARKIIRETETKKLGHNSYSNYAYFLPEQIEELVANACEKTGLIALCQLLADEYGYYQELQLVNLENTEESLFFKLRTEKGEIKATSATQQMGGTDTYSERYLKQKVFCIKDNSLDPDSQAPVEAKNVKTAKDENWDI